jgi:CheY-like chemotaxis protein
LERVEVSKASLAGLRALIVEDESMLTMFIEDALADLGCSVAAIASRVDQARAKAATADFDVAILDVNLNGGSTYPIAEVLLSKNIPFVFATGYGAAGIPQSLRQAPVLTKPFTQEQLAQALAEALHKV